MAIESQGLIVFFSTTSANSTAAAAMLEQVNSVAGPSGAAAVIDVTHLQSTAKEKLLGLRDEGNITLDCNFLATGTVQNKMRDSRSQRTIANIGIGFNDTAKTMAAMECYVSGFSVNAGVDAKLTCAITCEINGPVTWTTYTG